MGAGSGEVGVGNVLNISLWLQYGKKTGGVSGSQRLGQNPSWREGGLGQVWDGGAGGLAEA